MEGTNPRQMDMSNSQITLRWKQILCPKRYSMLGVQRRSFLAASIYALLTMHRSLLEIPLLPCVASVQDLMRHRIVKER